MTGPPNTSPVNTFKPNQQRFTQEETNDELAT